MKKRFLMLLFIGLLSLCACKSPSESLVYDEINTHSAEKPVTKTADKPASKSIQVSVLGYVANPGVYIMPIGSRVYEAINAAGGITEGGDINSIDLVNIIADGGRIYVAGNTDNQAENGPGASSSDKRLVNINLATKADFCTLPGIGEAKASVIISHREKYGPFSTIEDIMNVSGIKNGTFEKIKDYITVY